MRHKPSNQAIQRTATRCATTFSHDQNTSTSIGARARPPSLILFSLGSMRLLVLLSLVAGACSSAPHMRTDDQLAAAYRGDRAAIRAYFAQALRFCESSEIYAAPSEELSLKFRAVLSRIGDSPFAAAVSGTSPRIRSAVAHFISPRSIPEFPRTQTLLAAAPKIDFPLDKAYRSHE
jgi:hypothetical protein